MLPNPSNRRTLPSLPIHPQYFSSISPHPWQRSSLPARTRQRSPPLQHPWQRASLPPHTRQRSPPNAYFQPRLPAISHRPRSQDLLFNHDRSESPSPPLRSSVHRYPRSLSPPHRRSYRSSLHLSPRSHSPPHRSPLHLSTSRDISPSSDELPQHPQLSPASLGPQHRSFNARPLQRSPQSTIHTHSQSSTLQTSLTPPGNSYKQQPLQNAQETFYNARSAFNVNEMGTRSVPEKKRNPDRGSTTKKMAAKFVYLTHPAPQHCTQVLATLVVSLGPLCAGLGKGYSSPALASMAAMSAQGHHFAVSKDQGSWVASLSLLGAFFGSLPAGMSIRWGRKRVLSAVAIPFALSWVMTVLATNIYMLYAAAFLGGVCSAVIAVVTPVYISEIAHPEIRGCLCALAKLSSNIGMLLSYLLGAFLNWRQLATVTAIAPACLFVTTLLIPETPSFLLYRGKDAEAAGSLRWLRGSASDVSRELTTMKANIATLRRQEQQKPPRSAPKDLARPLFITCGLMVFQKFSGANAFNFYAVPILSETFVGLNPYRAAVVVAFVQICAGMASSALVDTVGRRPLLVFSNMLMSAALAAFGGYVYLKGLDQNEDLFARQQWKESDWVPLFCILVIEIAFSLGVSPISWLYIGELFPLKHRGFGALAASVSYACSFASVKTFVDLQMLLGLYGTFWLYASVAALALVFTLMFVPETKGKSLQEMQSLDQQKETLI